MSLTCFQGFNICKSPGNADNTNRDSLRCQGKLVTQDTVCGRSAKVSIASTGSQFSPAPLGKVYRRTPTETEIGGKFSARTIANGHGW